MPFTRELNMIVANGARRSLKSMSKRLYLQALVCLCPAKFGTMKAWKHQMANISTSQQVWSSSPLLKLWYSHHEPA